MTEVSRRTLIVVGCLALVTLGYLLSIHQEKNQLMAEEENMKETLSSCLSNHHRCKQDLLTCKDETTQQQPRSDSLTQLLQQEQTMKAKEKEVSVLKGTIDHQKIELAKSETSLLETSNELHETNRNLHETSRKLSEMEKLTKLLINAVMGDDEGMKPSIELVGAAVEEIKKMKQQQQDPKENQQ